MDISDMLRKLDSGAELRTQLDDGVTTYWFRTVSPAGLFLNETINEVDALLLIGLGFVDQNELETDGEGVWFMGYEINDAGRKRVAQITIASPLEILDRAPDVPPEPGDELPDEPPG